MSITHFRNFYTPHGANSDLSTHASEPKVPGLLLPMLKACSSMGELKQAHSLMIKNGLAQDHFFLGRLLFFTALSEHGSLHYAGLVFDSIDQPDAFLYNSLIRAYSQSTSFGEHAILLYIQMRNEGIFPNNLTYPFVLKACVGGLRIEEGRQVHGHVLKTEFESDIFIINMLLSLYVKVGDLDGARRVFDKSPNLNSISWNTLINAYGKNGDICTARQLFDKLPQKSIVSWNTMLSLYSEGAEIDMACKFFEEMPERDVISWNTLMTGLVRNGRHKEGLELFHSMQISLTTPDHGTFVMVLSACAHLGSLERGQQIHAHIAKNNIKVDVVLSTALIDMYAKCGDKESAKQAFELKDCSRRGVMAWTAMISGLAMHGHGKDALQLFSEMESEGIRPNEITFIGALSACSHAGLVEEGKRCFRLMQEYKIVPMMEHYGCMVDLLGRAGLLCEAEELILSMPMKPNMIIWSALLSACRIHGDLEMGEQIGKGLIESEPNHTGLNVLLANIFSASGRWGDAMKIRERIKGKGIRKPPGCSTIELNGEVHEFVAGESSHPQAEEIYKKWEEIYRELKLSGHVPNTASVLFDLGEEEKETLLHQHSEKLAVAFALMNTRHGKIIRILKNLRMCKDCHSATKSISKIFDRRIIVRDLFRFHDFKDGSCSCMDYW
ncbi:pentatricopeptide repeat-containing protein At5g66520-like [Amborella trichopoda]|uniref:pentatricopeptide repeat-containing protein At5g66520-like n=1 Tax=Amborella trichopoda TaxID=13333 RepID=UPI0005D360B2|nr:pentatricopeptide repeat-containing protein At5g66520-like [Amborella trichopoda]|eukprot:XP_011624792.1 pentatricopeptide repeat-containing protein At5g66520-like [Amborella trichopoda]